MATIKLIFGRTECDPETQWANLKECEVEVPSWVTKDSETWGRLHLLGMVTEPTKAATGDECFEEIEEDTRGGMSKEGWIGTNERLPDQDGMYLVVFENEKGCRWVGIHTFADGDWIKYISNEPLRIIYWQPIPDIPTKEGDDE